MEHLDKGGILHEGQAGFRVNRSCMDNVFMLNELVQGRLRENKHTYTRCAEGIRYGMVHFGL